jgi:hypothetical protein
MKPESTHKDFEPNKPLVKAVQDCIDNNYTLQDILDKHNAQFTIKAINDPELAINTALKMIAYFHMYAAKLHQEKYSKLEEEARK